MIDAVEPEKSGTSHSGLHPTTAASEDQAQYGSNTKPSYSYSDGSC